MSGAYTEPMLARPAAALLVVMMSTLCGEPASAQSGYLQGGFAIDSRRFSGAPGDRVFDANASTITFGGGGFLSAMVSAGVEVDLGGQTDVAQSSTVTIAGRPENVTTTYTSRRRSVSALFGIHTTAAR